MSLKAKLTRQTVTDEEKGFQLIRPGALHFQSPTDFEAAIKAQNSATALMSADHVKSIGIDGNVLGTDWTLSHAAFGDLCHFARIPVAFIKALARINEAQALDVVETMIHSVFRSGPEKSLVLDTRCGRIDGIVGKDTYSHIPNEDALAFLLTAAPGISMTNGWLAGPNMRVTAVTKDRPTEAKKGDIVHFGVNLENAIHGDRALKANGYMERLVCTNGAVCTEPAMSRTIIHRGDVAYETQKAVIAIAEMGESIVPIVKAAPFYMMMDTDIRKMRSFLGNPENGGSQSLEVIAVKEAMNEAAKENRPPEETTLWNWHNAVTAHAKSAPTVQRRTDLEAVGYRALVRFGAVLAN